MFCTVAEYILTFGRVPRQPRIISRSGDNGDDEDQGQDHIDQKNLMRSSNLMKYTS